MSSKEPADESDKNDNNREVEIKAIVDEICEILKEIDKLTFPPYSDTGIEEISEKNDLQEDTPESSRKPRRFESIRAMWESFKSPSSSSKPAVNGIEPFEVGVKREIKRISELKDKTPKDEVKLKKLKVLLRYERWSIYKTSPGHIRMEPKGFLERIGLRSTEYKISGYFPCSVEDPRCWTGEDDKPLKNESMYCIGGQNDKQELLSSVSFDNSIDQRWKNGPSMSTGLKNFSGAVIRDKIYVCDDDVIQVLDTRTDQWSALTLMPGVRKGSVSAALDGFIYVAGGSDDRFNSLTTVQRYNVRTREWEAVAPMLEPRCGHQLVELGGCLYAISGKMSQTAERYDPSTNKWTMVSSLKYSHVDFSATTHCGNIYVCSAAGFEFYSPVDPEPALVPIGNCWQTLTPINDDYHGRSLASFMGGLYALGGGKNGCGGTAEAYFYSFTDNQWGRCGDMDVARMFHCSFVVK